MTYKDSLSLSWRNIKANKLRTIITVIIIALGIFALILIITAIQAATSYLLCCGDGGTAQDKPRQAFLASVCVARFVEGA